jgi:group I intron endonuclease
VEQQKIYGIIYKVTNKVNGKAYIGQTINLKERMRTHIRDALNNRYNSHFHKAIRKYGISNFEWKIVAKCNSIEELNRAEVEMIRRYDTFNNGYNLNMGGNGYSGLYGKNHPLYGTKLSKEHKRKIGDAHIGKPRSEETKKKISEAKKGRNNPNYGKYGKDNPCFGKTHSEETKRKISRLMEGEKNPMYGKHHSEETKKKISETNTGRRIGSESASAKKYIVTTPEGEEVFVYGIANFCKNYKKEKLYFPTLIAVARGKRAHHKGYKCEYFVE